MAGCVKIHRRNPFQKSENVTICNDSGQVEAFADKTEKMIRDFNNSI
jgi:hypothetical protein